MSYLRFFYILRGRERVHWERMGQLEYKLHCLKIEKINQKNVLDNSSNILQK